MERRAFERALPALAVLAALAAHSGAFVPARSPAELASQLGAEGLALGPASLRDAYESLLPPDGTFRPLVRLAARLDRSLGESPRIAQAADALLGAAAAALAYGILARLARDARIAAFGATLYGVLPIRTEAVASIAGRAHLLSALAIFAAWLAAIRNSERRDSGAESAGLAFAASAAAFAGAFADSEVALVLPLALATCWILRRRVPWLTFAAISTSLLAYLAVRSETQAKFFPPVSPLYNPLGEAGLLQRLSAGASLLLLYLWKTAVPVRLSADYSYDQIRLASASPWVLALGIVGAAAILAGPIASLRRRAPLVAIGAACFGIALVSKTHLLVPAPAIFAERYAHAAALGVAIAACGVLSALRARPGFPSGSRRRAAVAVLAALLAVFAARAWLRSRAWADPIALAIRLPREAPRSAWARLKAAEAYLRLSANAARRDELYAKAKEELSKALEILPGLGRAEALLGNIAYEEGDFVRAIQHLDRAAAALVRERPVQVEPLVYRLRAECNWRLGRPERALADLDPYIQLRALKEERPDPRAHNFRGLALGVLGRLEEALQEFTRGIEANPDLPELWNNRGYCRFQLKDARGALADYERGAEVCRRRGLIYARTGDTVWSFLRRSAEVHDAIAKAEREAGRAEEAERASAEAERLRAEAAKIAADAEPERASSGAAPSGGAP